MSPCLASFYLAFLLFIPTPAWSQPSPQWNSAFPRHPIEGEVLGMPVSERLFVEIADPSSRVSLERVSVNVNGSFRFFSSPPDGDCEVRVVTDQNIVLEKVWVRAGDPRPKVRIQLRDWPVPNGNRAGAENTVSAYRLTHKVPKKARSEYSNAVDDYKKHRIAESVKHLKKALALDGGFVEALNSLGGHLLEMNQPRDAASYLRKAVELDPTSAVPTINLSLALLSMGEVKEAETLARKAVLLDGGAERAQKLLDLCLRVQGKAAN